MEYRCVLKIIKHLPIHITPLRGTLFSLFQNIQDPEIIEKKDGLSENLTCKCTVHVGQATSFIRLPDPSLEPVETRYVPFSVIINDQKQQINTMKYIIHKEYYQTKTCGFSAFPPVANIIRNQKTSIQFVPEIQIIVK